MLSRRNFSACAICAVTGFIATDASADTATPAGASGFTRKLLSKMEGPAPDFVTLVMEVEIQPGVIVPRHTHPGIESGYVVEGTLELPVQGQPTRTLKPGDGFQIPVGTPHAGGKPSDTRVKVVSTYVVEKDKPLASPAPE